jgi:hypothetical protein
MRPDVNPMEYAPPGTMDKVRDYWSRRQVAEADHEASLEDIRSAMMNLKRAVEDAYGEGDHHAPESLAFRNRTCVASEDLRKLRAWLELQDEWLQLWLGRATARSAARHDEAEEKREAAERLLGEKR